MKTLKMCNIAKTISLVGVISISLVLAACGGGGSGSAPVPTPSVVPTPVTPPSGSANMTVAVTANKGGATCGYNNAPCVSVTVCNPNSPTDCVVVNNILLDTGSTGLRVFSSLLNGIKFPIETTESNQVAECVTYADKTANWGPVALANIQLAPNLTSLNVPMQIIDSSYVGASSCTGAANSATPADFGVNGILGVGPRVHDNGRYFSCNGIACTGGYDPASDSQVSNPIALLSDSNYNNGLTLKFPAVAATGNSDAIGYAIFGVGTNSDNAVGSGVNVYPSTGVGGFSIGMPVQYSGNSGISTGFLDTGSNGLFFDDSSIPQCSGFYCPSNTLSLSASNKSTNGFMTVNFDVANADTLFNSGNSAFSNLGGPFGNGAFDYGMPFFFGRTVYIGFVGESSSIGSNAYWAF